ncbi:MAG TPA: poly-beta-1,6-N-acetyl-D-glucosamine synthase [Geothermobacteraceae bacterium]|nr:poly-beta-1,6-N-acetyl-D-glucosamine synthase [Geothermobacteraceae bacterium]
MLDITTIMGNTLLNFAYYYPLFMAYLWMIGAIYYYFRWERRSNPWNNPPQLPSYPPVSVVVPCYNEAENIEETLFALTRLNYPDYEVIAVNDGSTDSTGAILDAMAANHARIRVVHLAQNQGKAMALRMGSMLSKSEFLVCIDGDALLDEHAVTWMMQHFLRSPRVAGVTGNPRIRTRSTLLGKIQVGEFSAILGLIKRAQRIYGRVFTMSGVVSAFRKSALHQVGYWSLDMLTEDIDISWKLQMNYWDIRFEPHALCWILMPETLRGLWKQRLRWAQGGNEVLLRHVRGLLNWKRRRMWPVYIEYFTSILWGYAMLSVILLYFTGLFVSMPTGYRVESIIPAWPGVVLGLTCMFQFAISFALDLLYEHGLYRYYLQMIWYPLVFWLINMCTAVVALPRVLVKRRGVRARWRTEDRGIHSDQQRRIS